MPAGTSFDPCCRSARAAFGHPETVEGALNRHPKLRINLMHSGWPYVEEAEAMMMLYDNVNIDTGALSWLLPLPALNRPDSARLAVPAAAVRLIVGK